VGQIKVWDVTRTGGKLRATIRGRADDRRAQVIAYSADFKKAAGGDSGGQNAVPDLARRKEARSLEGHTGRITGLAFSPDGKSLASGSADGRTRVWDLETGRPRLTVGGEDFNVDRVAFSPDGKLLAVALRTLDLQYLIKLLDSTTSVER